MIKKSGLNENLSNEDDVLSFQTDIDRVIADYLDEDEKKFSDSEQKNRIKLLIEDFLRGRERVDITASKLLDEAYGFSGEFFNSVDFELREEKITKASRELKALKSFIDQYKGSGLMSKRTDEEKLEDIRSRLAFTIKYVRDLSLE